MNDFSYHRPLTGYSWIEEYKENIGMPQIVKDYDSIYDWLQSKPSGWRFNLEVAESMKNEEVRDYKIKLICMFIAENHFDYEFNETFTLLRRI